MTVQAIKALAAVKGYTITANRKSEIIKEFMAQGG